MLTVKKNDLLQYNKQWKAIKIAMQKQTRQHHRGKAHFLSDEPVFDCSFVQRNRYILRMRNNVSRFFIVRDVKFFTNP